ncbi:MAG: hypothetical protein HUJ89_05460 [Bacteroidales bacterium]|nr:hypothetical protein [Bacteroidales bacterium]
MKRILIITAALLCAMACGSNSNNKGLKTGDLIFIGVPWEADAADSTSLGSAIIAATGDADALNMVHVAIVEVKGDSIWVIDATPGHGVDRYPLDTFLSDIHSQDGVIPTIVVKRVVGYDVEEFVDNAKAFIGEPYDICFLPDNGAKYCSELVYDSYVSSDGKHLFGSKPMNFKNQDGEMPIYWEQLFSSMNMEVPQGIPGTNPHDMSKSSILEEVNTCL